MVDNIPVMDESLLKIIPFAIDIVDEYGNILFYNKKFSELFPDEIIGKKCWEIYKDDKIKCENCPLNNKIEIGVTINRETSNVFGGKSYVVSHTGLIYKEKLALLEIFFDINDSKWANRYKYLSELGLSNLYVESLPTVLIVDDDDVCLDLLENILLKMNVNIIKCKSGKETLEKINDKDITVALLDIRMPFMDGHELAAKINENRKQKVPVIFITASDSIELDLNNIKLNSFNVIDYVLKPFNKDLLKIKIEIFLNLFKQNQKNIIDNLILKEYTDKLTKVNNDLRISEEKFSKIFENSPDINIITDVETGLIINVNKNMFSIAGYDKEETIGKSTIEMELWPDIKVRNKYIELLKDKGYVKNFKTFFKKKDGSIFHALVSGELIHLNKECALTVVRDVTELKDAEETIKDQEDTYNKIVNVSPAMIYVYDLINNKNISVNTEMEKTLGYTQEEILKMNDNLFSVILHPDDVRKSYENNINIINSKNLDEIFTIEFRMHVKDNGYKTFIANETVFERDERGMAISKIGIAIDITKQKQLEYELRISEMLHSNIISSLDEGVAVLDKKLNYILVNDWMSKLLGKSQEEIIGKSIEEVIPVIKDIGLYDNLIETANGKSLVSNEKSMMLPNGNNIYFIATTKPFKVNGTINGILCIFKDVTIYRKVKMLSELSRELDNFIVSQEDIIKKIK